jgi:hypothetical protein
MESTHRSPLLCPCPNAMAECRAYIIGVDGKFVRAVELLCPDDDTANEYAKNLVDGHDVELWQGARKINAFKHTPG